MSKQSNLEDDMLLGQGDPVAYREALLAKPPKRSGRPVDDQARDYDDEVVGVFAEIMRDPFAENRDRLRAAENLVDRGHGKAVTPIALNTGKGLRAQLADMSLEELYAVVQAEPLPTLAAPVQDAEFEEVDPLLR